MHHGSAFVGISRQTAPPPPVSCRRCARPQAWKGRAFLRPPASSRSATAAAQSSGAGPDAAAVSPGPAHTHPSAEPDPAAAWETALWQSASLRAWRGFSAAQLVTSQPPPSPSPAGPADSCGSASQQQHVPPDGPPPPGAIAYAASPRFSPDWEERHVQLLRKVFLPGALAQLRSCPATSRAAPPRPPRCRGGVELPPRCRSPRPLCSPSERREGFPEGPPAHVRGDIRPGAHAGNDQARPPACRPPEACCRDKPAIPCAHVAGRGPERRLLLTLVLQRGIGGSPWRRRHRCSTGDPGVLRRQGGGHFSDCCDGRKGIADGHHAANTNRKRR